MKRSNTSKKAPKPEDLLEPQFIPYVATNRLSDNPKPEEVNKVFNTLLTKSYQFLMDGQYSKRLNLSEHKKNMKSVFLHHNGSLNNFNMEMIQMQ